VREILLIFGLFLLPGLLNAGDRYSPEEGDTLVSHTLDEVVISASRFSFSQFETPEAIESLGIQTISRSQQRTVPEALSLTPGVFVQKTNHGGGSPFIRGLTGNQTLLLLDGIRISNSTMRYGPNQYLNTIDMFGIGKMEVLRGNGSVQYGSDAIGGTVQVFTPELFTAEKPDWSGLLMTRLATHGMEYTLNGGLNFSGRKAAFRAGITSRCFGDVMGGRNTGRQHPSGYDEFDFDLKGKVLLSSASSLTLAGQHVHQGHVPVYHKVELENYLINEMDPQQRNLAYARFNSEMNRGFLKSVTATASWQKTTEGRNSIKKESDLLRREYDKVQTLGFSAEALVSSPDVWSGIAGLEVFSDLVNSSRTDTDLTSDRATLKRGLYPDGSTMTSVAAFTIHTLDLPDWILTVGTRFNTFMIAVEDEELGRTRLTPSALVGNLAVMRKITPASNLFVSCNTGFRAPNIDDLGTLGIVDFRYEIPNFNLKPEKSFQYQAGYKYQQRNFRADVFLYRNDLRNLIVRSRVEEQVIEGYPLYRKENSEKAFIEGAETAWNWLFHPSWHFNGSLTYTYGQNISKNEPARRIPPLFGRLGLDYSADHWMASVEYLGAGKQHRLAQGDIDDNRIPEGGTPGWNIFNLNGTYYFRFINVDLSLKNIFNKDYRYHGSGINGYGRSAFLTLTFLI